ncbi:MAG: YggT family protein [Candidatus Saccharibacteria bacterium]
MANSDNGSDTKLLFLKTARVLTYIVYAFMLVAVIFLSIGFFLLLFGANPNVGFTQFVYKVAAEFLQPFRGIFPAHQVGETGYFSTSALFAIIIYILLALGINSLITYITAKMLLHQKELEKLS